MITGSVIWKVLKGMVWKDDSPNLLGKALAAILAGVVALQVNNAFQRNVGRKDAAAKIEKKVEANVKATDAARARSRAGTGGVRDPYRRD